MTIEIPPTLPFGTYELRVLSTDPEAGDLEAVARSKPIHVGLPAPPTGPDLLVVAGNPLTDIAALEQVRAVVQAGRLVNLPIRSLVNAEQATLGIAQSQRP